VWQDQYLLGGLAFVIGSVCDTLDGRYSRMSGKGSLFGAFLDSTLDRVEAGGVIAAIAWHFADSGNDVAAAACVIVVLGSLMVSYTRARAEALGLDCKVGLMPRAERVVLLGAASLLFGTAWNGLVLKGVIALLAVLTNVTAIQRIIWVYQNAAGVPLDEPNPEPTSEPVSESNQRATIER